MGVVDVQDARLGVRAVGEDTHLVAGIGDRRHAALDQGHAEQGDGHLLSGRDHDVQFARNRLLHDLVGQADQTVGLPAHGGYHHDDVIAASRNFFTFSATCSIRSTVPTEVPPNFCTIKAISNRLIP